MTEACAPPEVPPLPEGGISDEELRVRLKSVYAPGHADEIARELAAARAAGDLAQVAAIHARFTYRMHDLSEFMKTLVQRFSRWYNRGHDRPLVVSLFRPSSRGIHPSVYAIPGAHAKGISDKSSVTISVRQRCPTLSKKTRAECHAMATEAVLSTPLSLDSNHSPVRECSK